MRTAGSRIATARARWPEGCILRAVVGSTVHGLSNPGTDDRDEMGACVEPRGYVLGLRPFDRWVFRTQPEGAPSGPGDLDLTIYGLRKYRRLALKGSPTVLLLFAQGDHVLVRTRSAWSCRRSPPRLSPGAPVARSRATSAPSDAGCSATATRPARASCPPSTATTPSTRCTRCASGIRGLELITTGRISLPVPEPARSHLMAVRRGELALPQVVADLKARTAALERAVADSTLPETADGAAVDAYLARAYEQTWARQPGS